MKRQRRNRRVRERGTCGASTLKMAGGNSALFVAALVRGGGGAVIVGVVTAVAHSGGRNASTSTAALGHQSPVSRPLEEESLNRWRHTDVIDSAKAVQNWAWRVFGTFGDMVRVAALFVGARHDARRRHRLGNRVPERGVSEGHDMVQAQVASVSSCGGCQHAVSQWQALRNRGGTPGIKRQRGDRAASNGAFKPVRNQSARGAPSAKHF